MFAMHHRCPLRSQISPVSLVAVLCWHITDIVSICLSSVQRARKASFQLVRLVMSIRFIFQNRFGNHPGSTVWMPSWSVFGWTRPNTGDTTLAATLVFLLKRLLKCGDSLCQAVPVFLPQFLLEFSHHKWLMFSRNRNVPPSWLACVARETNGPNLRF